MNDTTNPVRRLRHGDRPTAPLRWNDRWTLLLTGPHHGMIGPYGSTWPNQPAEYERVNVIAEDAEKLVAQEVTQQAAPGAPVMLMAGIEQHNSAFDKACGKFYCEHGRLPAPIEIFAIASTAPTTQQAAKAETAEQAQTLANVISYLVANGHMNWRGFEDDDEPFSSDNAEFQTILALVERALKYRAPTTSTVSAPDSKVKHGEVPSLEITLRQAKELVDCFGGHDAEISIIQRPAAWADMPDGLYAYFSEYPDEGSMYLGPTEVDDDLAMNGESTSAQASQAAAFEVRVATALRLMAEHQLVPSFRTYGKVWIVGTDIEEFDPKDDAVALCRAIERAAALRTNPATPASAQSATPDAVEAALADAIVHGTGAFRVNGDGSTEHVDLQRDALHPGYAVPVKPADEGGKPE